MPRPHRATLLAALREAIARHDAPPSNRTPSVVEGIDGVLLGGHLARGAIHEIFVSASGSSTAFCGYLLGCAGGLACWIMPPDAADIPWPAGLLALGLDPACFMLVEAAGQDALWAAEQALRSPALTAVAAVLPPLDLAAARRLQLAAEAGGTLGLILRPDEANQWQAPTAARTRWRITSLPGHGSDPNKLGAAGWRVDLLHARGARPGGWDMTLDYSNKLLILQKSSVRRDG